MRSLKYLLSLFLLLSLTACEKFKAPAKQEYPEISSLENSVWHYYDTKNPMFCDIEYGAEERGKMVTYNNEEHTEVLSMREFSYTFIPATEKVNGIVEVSFDDGLEYGGMLIHKGFAEPLINGSYVYWIQLYEIDSKGNIIYDENGKVKSSILMWKE